MISCQYYFSQSGTKKLVWYTSQHKWQRRMPIIWHKSSWVELYMNVHKSAIPWQNDISLTMIVITLWSEAVWCCCNLAIYTIQWSNMTWSSPLPYGWWFRNPVNSPVEATVASPMIYDGFGTIPGGWPWDFGTINTISGQLWQPRLPR